MSQLIRLSFWTIIVLRKHLFNMSVCGLIQILVWLLQAQAITQIAMFMRPTWGPPGSCWPQMGPMLAPWTLLSGYLHKWWESLLMNVILNGGRKHGKVCVRRRNYHKICFIYMWVSMILWCQDNVSLNFLSKLTIHCFIFVEGFCLNFFIKPLTSWPCTLVPFNMHATLLGIAHN